MCKDMIKPALTLTAICVVVAFLVSLTNFITADAIKQQEIETAEASKKAVLSTAESFTQIESNEYTAHIGTDANGTIVGYAVVTSAKGYGGAIQIMTGLDADGIVTGVVILAEEETQGLGKNANKEEFRSLFVGKDVSGYTVVKGDAANDGEITAITGATITTKAVTDAVNEAKSIYSSIIEQKGE